MNVEKAKDVLNQLASCGVGTLCICPGARNAPFIHVLAKSHGFDILSFYDERSAGFFALGRARRDKKAVAVLTTSGTAVSELLSPVIEAFYSDTPLIVLSSDRPKRLRGTGAPQAIEQSQIFEKYVEKSWDISAKDSFKLKVPTKKPIHINICFDEPLIDTDCSETIDFLPAVFKGAEPIANMKTPSLNLENPLVIVAGLEVAQQKTVETSLQNFQAPLFLEAASGIKGSVALKDRIIKGGEKIVSQMLKSGEVKSVLRIGDVPLGRFWRDLDLLDIPTYSITSKDFSGTENSKVFLQPLQHLSLASVTPAQWEWKKWQVEGELKTAEISGLINQCPQSEVSFFKQLAEQIPSDETVYLGNSLPVRIWDLVCEKSRSVFGNRGANGIDGQLSTALGQMKPGTKNWIVLGDLTTLYDFNGFWVSDYLRNKEISVNLVVINNGGGQIFSRIFDEDLFRNQHQLSFKPMAEMWGWNYLEAPQKNDSFPESGINLIEFKSSAEQNQTFWQEYDQLWKK